MRRLTAAAALSLTACGSSAMPPTHIATHTPYRDLPELTTTTTVATTTTHTHPVRPKRRVVGRVSRAGGCSLEDIKRMESGGNYGAVSRSGKYRGAYQFDAATWRSVGGNGDPAAASPEEQDARAAALMAKRGTQPWSVCK